MKKSVIRTLSLCLVALMLLGSFAGCGSSTTPTTTTTPSPSASVSASASASATAEPSSSEPEPPKLGYLEDTSPITFDVYFNASWFTEQWLTDIATRSSAYITKKTGVSLNLMAPTGVESERMTTMIASGEVPDIIISDFYDPNTTKLYQAGLLEPLNKLADQYDEFFYTVVKPSQIGWFTRDDGNIYDYPNFANAYETVMADSDKSFYAGDIVVAARKDIYEGIGSPDMTTPDGFLNALKAAKEKFPEVDGQPMIPIGMLFGANGSRFIDAYIPQLLGLPVEKDGKMYDNLSDPGYITWIKTLRKANEMGLIAKENFIDQRAQHDEKLNGARYFMTTQGRSDIDGVNGALFTANKDNGKYYIPVDAIRNSKQEDPKIIGKILLDGWMDIHITTACKDKARAIRFLNYMMGPEGQHDAYFGEKDVTYTVENGIDTIKPEVLADPDMVKKYYVSGTNWTFYNYEYLNPILKMLPKAEKTQKDAFIDYGTKYFFAAPQLSGITVDPSSDEGIAEQNIGTLWGETIPKLILAKSDAEFDVLLSDFLAKRDSMGYAMLMDARNAQYQINKDRLGMN